MAQSRNKARQNSNKQYCHCSPEHRIACLGDVDYLHEGKYYCVMHYPSRNKSDDFKEALIFSIRNNYTCFQGVYFPKKIHFEEYLQQIKGTTEINKAINFNKAVFYEEVFFRRIFFEKKAFFEGTIFKKTVTFNDSTFKDRAIFDSAEFHKVANFQHATFLAKADFCSTSFGGECHFNNAEFFKEVFFGKESENTYGKGVKEKIKSPTTFRSKVKFEQARFRDLVKFVGINFTDQATLSISETIFDKPELILLRNTSLKPEWFLDVVDAREFHFINVNWKTLTKEENLNQNSRHRLLARAYNQLASNAEENSRYEEASNFRQEAFNAEWVDRKDQLNEWAKNIGNILKMPLNCPISSISFYIETWNALKKIFSFLKNPPIPLIHSFYRFTSYYGESWRRAFVILSIILGASTFLYTTSYCVFKDGKQGFDFGEAISYTLRVMALQRPEPQPDNNFAKIVVACETILAPLQLALLALAIRRKFMR